mgnify:CR=1 FL=1
MSYINNLLTKYKDKKVLLIGTLKDYPEEVKIDDSLYMDLSSIRDNTRQPSLHSMFDAVFICDPHISNSSHWETILDEIVRFTKNRAVIIIHARSTKNTSVWGMKSFISDKINLSSKLLSQQIISRTESVFEMELTRERNYSKNWSIGIPSNGKKTASVIALVNSIEIARNFLQSKANIEIETDIMIVGKKDKVFDNYPVRFFEQSLDKSLGALGEKKYIISNNAIYENILLIHDRYKLDRSFFLGFEKWGYDFEFCTTQQYDSKGKIYDPLLYIENFDRADIQMYRVHDQSYPCPNLYINGGLIIVKKSIVNKINFNPVLLQAEAEDIDFAKKLLAVSIIPRFNPDSLAITSTDVDSSNLASLPLYESFLSSKN